MGTKRSSTSSICFRTPVAPGLHVGHPLGYIASDIIARYKRQQGFNVLHPQGYDSFGLPAEQYAIQTGQHPAITTERNIARYREQLDLLGFSYDWSREVRTSSPEYYRWTQWIFARLFEHGYDRGAGQSSPISTLAAHFAGHGNATVDWEVGMDTLIAAGTQCWGDGFEGHFTADQWNALDEKGQASLLMAYRLAYLADSEVNWCPALGTVLANDEVIGGRSERGGHPVVRKKMRQWMMRITAFADRLLDGLDGIDWSGQHQRGTAQLDRKIHRCATPVFGAGPPGARDRGVFHAARHLAWRQFPGLGTRA